MITVAVMIYGKDYGPTVSSQQPLISDSTETIQQSPCTSYSHQSTSSSSSSIDVSTISKHGDCKQTQGGCVVVLAAAATMDDEDSDDCDNNNRLIVSAPI